VWHLNINEIIKNMKVCRGYQLFVLYEKTAMRLRSQRPLYVQGDVGYPAKQGGGQENNKQKK
jgi:hypothetical protein